MQLLPTLFRVAENMTENPVISLTDACIGLRMRTITYEQRMRLWKMHVGLLFIFLLTYFVANCNQIAIVID